MSGRGWITAMMVLALLFAGCAQEATPTPTPGATPIPPVELNSTGDVRASGKVMPARKAEMAFSASGRVQTGEVEIGDVVEPSDLLVALEPAMAEAAVLQARATLFKAQAQLAQLQAGPRLEEIAAAEAQVEAAQARLAQLTEGAQPEEIAAAKAEVAAAQAALQQLFNGPREEQRIAALVALSNAKAALQQAQSAYNRVAWSSDVAMLPESRHLQEATNNLEAAQARYDALYAEPDADVVAAARARVQQAQAALVRLQTPGTPAQIAEAEAQVRSAQATLDLLKAGARDEALAVGAVAVSEAQAGLQRAEADLAATRLVAPFAGTVTSLSVSEGEMVLPGETVLTLADLSDLQVETTDLSERDVGRVAVGRPAIVWIEPLDVEIPGRVAQISPEAKIVGGDVVYTVVVDLEELPPNLRWGMSVEVTITPP
ncbi:MAG: HlyD family efflux transporter periplasmic adaptor subunit [Caldilineaceae bacterium]|nr:HlyD family efflux transporter periplasmic adaptor subunit [Caldilineaceae bacterium]